MATEREDPVSISIGEMLQSLSPLSPDCCIARVPNYLRKANEQAYEPELIAIGPYHHAKPHLKAMEEHKIRYFQLLLQERRENDVSRYVMIIRSLEEKARKCYSDPFALESDDFVKMLLLDGCFIVQLIRKFSEIRLRDESDPIFKLVSLRGTIRRDTLLVENQLPLFVLWELYAMIEYPDQRTFMAIVFSFFCHILPGEGWPQNSLNSIRVIKHLVDLVHECWHPSPLELKAYQNLNKNVPWNFIHCVTELKEAGIKFQMKRGNSLFDLKFENGTMKIPTLRIYDSLEGTLRNLIAFEQFSSHRGLNHVTDYVLLFHCLVNSTKDVEILRQSGIIENMLGDDEEVARMLNRLGVSVFFSPDNFYYSELFNKVNKYCDRRWNKWIANLKHNYLNSPWALISFLAAVVLLLLTLVQTIFSVLSFYSK
ncbi:Uncharacterized protein TCM_020392 [Theobroma cacao]|uniref:Uncharacterized protein n=1 Tax=Theobroma cacao TaxID=3641 RepID=A0A061ELY0_THECC|nr:Uncharacterized protein TCM_020392 [Theobroma cacao]